MIEDKTKEIKRLPYKIQKRKMKDINCIVIHGTGDREDSKENHTLKYALLENGLCKKSHGKILFHYFVNRSGVIYQLLELDEWAYHSNRGQGDIHTIGIEFENKNKNGELNQFHYTSQQYSAWDFLVDKLINELDIKIISTHDHWRLLAGKKEKPCPNNFNLDYCIDQYPHVQFLQ